MQPATIATLEELDNAAWFKAATARIDALKSVEDRVASDVMALTSAKRGDAMKAGSRG